MKFHCDRCKTRYSIADERVRGKILKIRCKNCSAVITVKEGVSSSVPRAKVGRSTGAAPAVPRPKVGRSTGAAPAVPRAKAGRRSTGASPAVSRAKVGRSTGASPALRSAGPAAAASRRAGAAAPASALSGAFEQEIRRKHDAVPQASDSMSSAPAVLEAEWYVSEDGEQYGPYSLAAAQAWVTGRASDAELYCWSEGFDDWLPTDKVSHFRGLRSQAGPPPGRPGLVAVPHGLAASGGLFDDTDDRTVVDAQPGQFEEPPAALPPPQREKTPVPLFAATLAQVTADAPTEIDEGDGFSRGAPPIPGQPDRGLPRPDGAHHGRNNNNNNGASARPLAARSAPGPAGPSNSSGSSPPDPGQSAPDLDIGEASRVVDLSMLSRSPGVVTPTASNFTESAALPGVVGGDNSPLGRGTGSFARVGALAAAMPIIQRGGTIDIPRPELLQPRRRVSGMMLPITIAGVVLIGLIAILLYVSLSGNDDEQSRLARGITGGENLGYQFGQAHPRGDKNAKSGSTDPAPAAGKTSRTIARRGSSGGRRSSGVGVNTGNHGGSVTAVGTGFDEVDLSHPGGLRELSPDDLMDAYNVNKIGVTMCYNSALKHNPLLKVQKAYVSIKVGTQGNVTSVSIPTLRGTELGTCLERRIKAWRFPRSTSGLSSRFPIVFDT